MAQKFQLEIVTPDRHFFSGEVEMVVVRTTEGDEAYMADHMWTVVPLKTGVLKIKENDKIKKAFCSGGFIHVKEGLTTIVADSAEWPEEIDVERAKAAKERAEKHLEGENANTDADRAKAAMLRALTRIKVQEEHKE